MLKFVATFLFVVLLHLTGARPTDDNDELIAVAVVFRHGDRTIIDSYPNDPYLNYSWPVGLGQLTNQGKLRLKRFGSWFKQKYSNIMSFDASRIFITSTNTSRTQNSLQIFLKELFNDSNQFSINTIPVKEDCPKYDQLYAQYSKQIFGNFSEDYKKICDYCAKYTGRKIKTLDYFESLHGILENEGEEHNLPLPEWTKLVYPNKTKALSGISFASHCGTPELARLLVGSYFNFLLKNFNSMEGYKLMIYSGHDVTIANILKSIGKFDNVPPPYVSSILFELHNSSHTKFLNIYYKIDDELRPITLDNCVFDCPLSKVVDLLGSITIEPKEWQHECIIQN